MPKLLFAVAALFTCLLIAGCATPPLAGGVAFQKVEAPPNGFARLYILRPGFTTTGSDDQPTLHINTQAQGFLGADRYTEVVLPPGRHVISLTPRPFEPSFWNANTSVTLEANTTYFLALWNATESVSGVQVAPGMGVPFLLLPASGTRSTGVRFELIREEDAVPVLQGMQHIPPASNTNGQP